MNPESAARLERARTALEAGDAARAEQEASEALARDPACVEAAQALARAYLGGDDEERAQSLLGRRDEFPKTEAFAAWGEIAEALSRLDEAGAIYAEHLQRYPRDAGVHYRAGLTALARGERDRARAAMLSAVKLDATHAQAAAELARLYDEDGLLGSARELYDRALAAAPEDAELMTARDLVEERLREWQALPEVRIDPVETAAAALLRLFDGREGVYARQWADADGRVGYAPVHEPLTPRVLEAHVRGELTAGVYVLRADDTARFMAFDIDITKQALARVEADPEARSRLDGRVLEDVRRLTTMLERLDLPCAVESSGCKGAHVWVCLAAPMPAERVRAFARAIEHRVGPPPEGLHRELFPKQDRVPAGRLGNLIKLPLGVHKKTGRRALFIDARGRALADQVRCLEEMQTVTPDRFSEGMRRLVGARPEEKEAAAPTRPPSPAAVTTLEALRERFPAPAAVWEGCAVVRALIRKAQTDHHLTHPERRVLACIFAHLGDEGVALLHAVIANCLDYTQEVTQYQIDRTRDNPISCPRIRRHIPEITATAGCACTFDLPEKGYPSPVLFADPGATAGRARPRPEQHEGDALIERYVDAMGRWRALRREMEAAEKALRERLERTEEGTLLTDAWRVTRHPETGELHVELRRPP